MFHKHRWIKIKETYAPPLKKFTFTKAEGGAARDFLEKAVFGVVTILWECEICYKIRKEEMLGKEK